MKKILLKEWFSKVKDSGIIHNFTMNVDPGHKCREKFRGDVQWYVMEKNFISSTSYIIKNEKNQIVSFNGQSINFRLSINEV